MRYISLELGLREDVLLRKVQFPQLSLPALQKSSINNPSHFMLNNQLLMLFVPA